MAELFLKIVNMSISATWLVLAVLVLRFFLKKAPKWVSVLLWGIVAVRLLCPFSIESALSLIPSAETISPEIMYDQTPQITTGINAINNVVNPILSESLAPAPSASANPLQIWIPVISVVWMIGMAVMILYTAVSYLRLRRSVRTATKLYDNLYQSAHIPSPFVLGIVNPKIYLPYGMKESDMSHVIAHEQTHIRRRDHWWKPLGFLLLTIHWFNPLMWVAYILLCRDIELACDEKVIKELGRDQRADYSQALLTCSVDRKMIAACPLAFGEVGVKERVKNVLSYKKPAFWVIVTALVVCVVVAVCFLTNPKRSTIYDIYEQDGYTVIDQEEVDVTLYIDKSKLPDSIYTSEGYAFEEDEVIVYSTETSRIYLDKVMISNESDDLLYFVFDFSYDFPKSGSIISPYKYTGENDGMDSNLYLRSKDLRDGSITYPEALHIRSHGPGTQFAFYVSKEACQAANRTLMIDIVCNQIVYSKEGHGYESQHSSSSQVKKWFDYLESPDEMQWDGRLEINLPVFPDVTFRWYPEKMEAVTDDGITPLYTGMPIWNTYFCDLTGDGKPELCATVSFGSGLVDTHVVVYDYVSGQEYTLWDRGYYDFSLRLEDDILYWDQYVYADGGAMNPESRVGFGELALTEVNGIMAIDRQYVAPVLGKWVVDIVDRSVTEQLPIKDAFEVFYENAQYTYVFSGIRSHLVMVTYSDGTTADIKTALETGMAEIGDLDRFGIQYYAKPKDIPLKPTQTNLRGLVAGYLFTPIDGATYRYQLSDQDPKNVTADQLLDTFTEETNIEGIVWSVYSLKEYPDMTKLLMISGINSAWLCEYAPAKQAEEGALEAARAAGYVIQEDGKLTDGKEVWEEFYEKTRRGEHASIYVAHYYTLDPDRTAPGTYEAYRQDYPALYIDELSYDGEKFLLRTEEDVRVYEYLMKYTGIDQAVSSMQGDEYTRYVLTHDNTVTWEQLWNGLISSIYGAYIDHYTICTELY